jgi:hypothetical protein
LTRSCDTGAVHFVTAVRWGVVTALIGADRRCKDQVTTEETIRENDMELLKLNFEKRADKDEALAIEQRLEMKNKLKEANDQFKVRRGILRSLYHPL